ncbi:aminotransferase class I/II-fold pyridoxal phosphate-dependent enzyme [Pilimelia terevasa]|uniref:aminotransferase class I/II-fold pyridoxal phosphate-dependent enzyme n=1 Tax=Pilimelia terevasa TaxID=53372 RepID=UPI00166CFFCC|nr:aminotransferase class I/II-fold pyridoxal phosphate-dependent enzyme [Pilimelia terevasa]
MAEQYQFTGDSASTVAAGIEAGVRRGDLPPGTALPPVRALAGQLGLAAGTVARAYADLRQRGIVETAGRHGTRIRPRPPIAAAPVATPTPAGLRDHAAGEPDPALLPDLGPALRALAAAPAPANYAQGGPLPALCAAARARLAADGVPADHLAVTAGALDAIDRLLSAHLRPGDRVAVEDPGWGRFHDLIAALGLVAVPLPVDDDGPTVAGLRRALAERPSCVLVTSRAHNPTGAALTAARAAALQALLRPHPHILTIDDDHSAELATTPLCLLGGGDGAWAYVRSTAKPYGPDLRLAVVAGDAATVARVAGRMNLGSGWVSTLLQRIVLHLWQDPAAAAAVDRARAAYADRRRLLHDALAVHGVAAHGRTGLNLWIPVADEAHAVTVLRDRGYQVSAGSRYRLGAPPGIRVTISTLTAADAPALAAAVAAAAARPRASGV